MISTGAGCSPGSSVSVNNLSMGVLSPFRQMFNRVRRKVRRWRAETQPFIHGLPPGLDHQPVQTILADALGSRPSSFSYQHLSAWKASGAYRVRVRTVRGAEITLIYKEARYSEEEIPALINFPIRPGPSEYILYSQANEVIAPYLPKVYLAQEVIPQIHYRYLFEDLALDYARAKEHNNLVNSSALLPVLHRALKDWAELNHENGLLVYGDWFSRALQGYVSHNLRALSEHIQHPALKEFLDHWSEIKEIHLAPEFTLEQPGTLIHGDANHSNIHIHKRDPLRFKVVDWEWAGFGTSSYADLAALLKGTPVDVEKAAFDKFTCSSLMPRIGDTEQDSSPQNNYRKYLWCKLERGLIDASFLAAQSLSTANKTKFNLQNAVITSIQHVQSAYHQLAQ